MEQFQQVFLFYQSDPLALIPYSDQVISRLDMEDRSRLGRDHNLPFLAHFDQSKDMFALGRDPKSHSG